jgi:hypothetical protein
MSKDILISNDELCYNLQGMLLHMVGQIMLRSGYQVWYVIDCTSPDAGWTKWKASIAQWLSLSLTKRAGTRRMMELEYTAIEG